MAAVLSVLETDLVAYRRTWRASVISSFILPTLFVIGFGFSVGKFVDSAGQLGSVHYLDFIAPGMLASAAMQLTFGESSFPVFSKFEWIRTYHAMAAAPLRIVDIVGGDLLFLLLRLLATSVVFLGVTTAFGAVHSWWALAALPVTLLLGLAVAAPVFAFSARVDQDGYFPLLTRFAVIPMSLFAGVYFPISRLPEVLRWLAYVSPLWHAVTLCRAATLPGFGVSGWAVAGHLAYLAAWAGIGFWLALRSFGRRLTG
ncbi:ABC transporter permease [Rugosimonospora acidiphila]|uniref:Transport permease protein n=1 Tax=Rugosimonospora acidiphila TaxID=556531 RepID=A0ABP9RQI2_9ACTN